MHDEYEPLKITATMRTGVVSDQWLPLDAILFYQAHRLVLGPEIISKPGGNATSHKVSVPLKCINSGTPDWFFACSWAYPQPWWVAEGSDNWNKRFDNDLSDLIDFGKRRGKVIIEEAQYKSYHVPIYYRVALFIEWYCVGKRRRIKELLSTVTHVGKKTSQGWGRVSDWSIESWPDDWSCYGPGGELMRGIPLAMNTRRAGDTISYGIRPSYYRTENNRILAVPR